MTRYTTIIKEYCNDFEHEIVGSLKEFMSMNLQSQKDVI